MKEWLKRNMTPLAVGFFGVILALVLLHWYADHRRVHIFDQWGAGIEKRLKEANIK